LSKKRTNITIDPHLYDTAADHARTVHGTDFSGLVTKLIVADLGEAYIQKKASGRADEIITLLKRITGDEERRMYFGPRARKQGTKQQEAKHFLKHADSAAKKKQASRAQRKSAQGDERHPHSARP
jgi:hypothetical protein